MLSSAEHDGRRHLDSAAVLATGPLLVLARHGVRGSRQREYLNSSESEARYQMVTIPMAMEFYGVAIYAVAILLHPSMRAALCCSSRTVKVHDVTL